MPRSFAARNDTERELRKKDKTAPETVRFCCMRAAVTRPLSRPLSFVLLYATGDSQNNTDNQSNDADDDEDRSGVAAAGAEDRSKLCFNAVVLHIAVDHRAQTGDGQTSLVFLLFQI